MQFEETPLSGAFLISLEKRGDDRGFFARAFCVREFEDHGLSFKPVQMNNSLTEKKATLRGMHYQLPPWAETKLIRCIKGSVYDQILDLRPDSPTFGQSFGAELSATNRKAMLVPKGFAHGFMTLEDDSEVFYAVDQYYSSEWERGIRWNDSKFQLKWPFEPSVVSERDQGHPDYNEKWHQIKS